MSRLSPRGHNRHHTLFERADMCKTQQNRTLRSLGGLILTLPIEDHNELHAQVMPLTPPSQRLGRIMLETLLPHEESTIPRIERFEMVRFELWDVADHARRNLADEAAILADNFEQQAQYFERVLGNT